MKTFCFVSLLHKKTKAKKNNNNYNNNKTNNNNKNKNNNNNKNKNSNNNKSNNKNYSRNKDYFNSSDKSVGVARYVVVETLRILDNNKLISILSNLRLNPF